MIISKKTTLLFKLVMLLVIFNLSPFVASAAAHKSTISREEYINRYRHIAIDHQKRYGIPASITMAQGILESGNGNSTLSRKSNNHFGIKCKGDWKGRSVRHTDDAPDECFRAYDKVEESYEDHAKFLKGSPRYESLFSYAPTDYERWAKGLKAAGYATAKDYAPRLIKIIEDHKLYLLDEEAQSGQKAYDKAMRTKSKRRNMQPAVDGVNPNNYSVSIGKRGGYVTFKTNRSKYIRAKQGDSFKSLSKSLDTPRSVLARNNDMRVKDKISAGDVIYLERKQSKWRGIEPHHRVASGETVAQVAQQYALRESSLRKLNDLGRKDQAAVGSVLRLR